MNVSLTPELERYIRQKVDSGFYGNASEVVREALRLMHGREAANADRARHEQPPEKTIHAELAALEKPLRERGLTALALFGSIARGTSRPDSDVDVLIDVAPGARFS